MVAILTGYGINADKELATAFQLAGAETEFIHLGDCMENPALLKNKGVIAFPGGFSFGDHIGSGTILAHIVRNHFKSCIQEHLEAGGLILGICNGFQALVKMGLLPNTKGDWSNEASLIHNPGGRFMDKWVALRVNADNSSPWIRGLEDFDCPVRHGEGQFIPSAELRQSFPENQIAFMYKTNPNGSFMDIAGISDSDGRVLGLMPHPEAFLRAEQHPVAAECGLGLKLFQNAVKYLRTC